MVVYWSCLFYMFMDGDVVEVHKHATREAVGKFPVGKIAPLESQSLRRIWFARSPRGYLYNNAPYSFAATKS